MLPIVAVPSAGAASVPPIPSPATVLSVSPTNTNLNFELQGAVCQSPNTCTPVVYVPFYDPSGVTALQNALSTTSASKIIVFGYSDGAMVAEQWLKQHLNDPNAPSPKVLSFVVIGNATRAGTGLGALNGEVWPQSAYQVIDIARQYDGTADYPNNPASPYYPMAVLNASIGPYVGLHDYSNVNINDPANAVWTSADGNITYVLVPTQNVPILGVFAPLFPSLNAQLKAQIETAYTRPVPFPTTQPASPASSPAAASALSTSVVSDPTVAPEHTTVSVSLAPAATPATTATAPPATGPTNTNRLDTAAAAADTTVTPKPAGAGNGVRTAQTITAPAAKPRLDTASLDNAIAATDPITSTTHTPATSSTHGNTSPTGKTDATRGKTASSTTGFSKAR